MLGLFNIFGRSPDLKALDQALRDAGLHPRTVPEAVKLTAVRLLRENAAGNIPEAAFEDTALLLGYCMLGRDQFIASTASGRPIGSRSAWRRRSPPATAWTPGLFSSPCIRA